MELRTGDFQRSGRRGRATVCVNFVSKRISQSTLREAFEVYGRVTEVYIAYKNPRRIKMRRTFAFIRFSNMGEALRAVEFRNNRKMDGFIIKVFLEKNLTEEMKIDRKQRQLSRSGVMQKKDFSKVLDGRTYKEALLLNHSTRAVTQDKSVSAQKAESEKKEITVVITEMEYQWLGRCLVGRIKAMYDADLVQKALRSDGFRVKVCRWSGNFVLICFEEDEQLAIFWDLKETLLKEWFSDIDTIDNFMNKKKLQVWACIEGIPLAAWHVSVIEAIGSHWGNVIRLDSDTKERNRLDVARILLGVSCLSDIPAIATIVWQGEKVHLRVSTTELDEDRCWIDQEEPNSPYSPPSGSQNVLFNTHDVDTGEKTSPKIKKIISKEQGYAGGAITSGGALSENNLYQKLNLTNGPAISHIEKVVGGNMDIMENSGLISESRKRFSPNGDSDLREVPIMVESESYSSSGLSASLAPCYDLSTGMYSIKPKLLSRSVLQIPMDFVPKPSIVKKRGSSPSEKSRAHAKGVVKKGVRASPLSSPLANSSNKVGSLTAEAKNSMKFCAAARLTFDATEEEIIKRFVEVENDIVD
ncbi:hypothetical protein V6N13_083580 [Hibiscus sabdariffa]|uniref:RRM domain-containing protein n=1 Tax=Hibiscus sabdariffa TaxID=183260 RepID=A0ABR2SYG0_9ROSI